jgi:DNA-binding IclR family transcriptional regulator
MMYRVASQSDQSSKQGIQSIEVGSRVLLALARHDGPSMLSEVAKGSGMHPSKVHRYLVSLVRVGLASQDVNTGLYDLGPATRYLGIEALRRPDAVSIASAYATRLRDTTGHAVNVGIWSETGPLIVRWDSGSHVLPIAMRVGSILPLLDSAIGYVFLAYLPRRGTSAVLKRQQRQRETRLLPPDAVDAIVNDVRRDGFASATGLIFGLGALSAPVFGADGTLELALGLAMPRRMFTDAAVARLSVRLRSTADEISHDLGFGAHGGS